MMGLKITGFCLAFYWVLLPNFLYAATASEVIQSKVDEVVSVLQVPAGQAEMSLEEKKAKVLSIVESIFDYGKLSQLSLGRDWRRITSAQQDEFVLLFSKLLTNTYMEKVLSFGQEEITVVKEVVLSDDVTEVQTSITTSDNKIIPVAYRLSREGQGWKVFDVVIEGVSLAKNYRSQFSNYLKQKSIEQLIALLKEKVSATGNKNV